MVLKAMLIGHSYVRHLIKCVKQRSREFTFTLNLDPKDVIKQFSGESGATVDSLTNYQLRDIEDFEPDIVIDIGTDDLSLPSLGPETLTSQLYI